MPKIDGAKLTEIYNIMLRCRSFEERAIAEYRKGLPGFIHSAVGQEVMPATFCSFLRDDDYILTTHRGHADITAKGARFDKMMAELFAKKAGYCKGKGGSMHIAAVDRNIIGATGIVADGVPIASGVALGCKMQNIDRVIVCFLGDGATCAGAFHEGMGFAAIWDLPVVFACTNNFYQQSTPIRDYTKLTDLTDRAKAYGIPAVSVDGNDPEALAPAASEAVERARCGKGPTFVVGTSYRFYGHHMGDPGTDYRTKEEVEEWRQKDPIVRFRDKLIKTKLLTEAKAKELQDAIDKELDEAVKYAVESPEPELEEALTDIYYESGQNQGVKCEN